MIARPTLERLVNPSIEILDNSGELYSDGWLSASFGFRFRALVDIDRIVLRLWNPDFAARYLNNHVTVSVDDVARVSPPLCPGQMVKFTHPIDLLVGDTCRMDIISEQFCEADSLDPRERGVICVGSSFSPTESGTRDPDQTGEDED